MKMFFYTRPSPDSIALHPHLAADIKPARSKPVLAPDLANIALQVRRCEELFDHTLYPEQSRFKRLLDRFETIIGGTLSQDNSMDHTNLGKKRAS